jgi:hypothetical protein
VLLIAVCGCRAGFSGGPLHRARDNNVSAGTQFEGGVIAGPASASPGLGTFFLVGTMSPVGESEGHSGWYWWMVQPRYRRPFEVTENRQLYWAVGAGLGAGNRDGLAIASHGEIGAEGGAGAVTIDVSLRHVLMRLPDGELNMITNALMLGLTIGSSNRRR